MKSLMQGLLRGYKRWISPMLPHACRFVPTCSEYALEAVERHGALRGGWLALVRLLRCHPFASAGYDPVPTGATRSLPCCDPEAPAAFAAPPKPISRHY